MSTNTPATQVISSEGAGLWDITSGLRSWRLWAFLGLQDIRQRYRRSSFGPLWLALGLGVTIVGIGLLYAQILKVSPGNFIPFLALSLLIWNFISAVLNESTGLFQGAAGMMTSMRMPYTTLALRCIVRNLIVAAHCVVPAAIALVYYKYPVTPAALMAIPGLLLLVANLYWISIAIGLVCLRFRDVQQIIIYGLQLALFLTPIIWQPSQIRAGSAFLAANPLYHLIEVIRGPVFEHRIPATSFEFCLILLPLGGAATLLSFVRLRRQMVYWI